MANKPENYDDAYYNHDNNDDDLYNKFMKVELKEHYCTSCGKLFDDLKVCDVCCTEEEYEIEIAKSMYASENKNYGIKEVKHVNQKPIGIVEKGPFDGKILANYKTGAKYDKKGRLKSLNHRLLNAEKISHKLKKELDLEKTMNLIKRKSLVSLDDLETYCYGNSALKSLDNKLTEISKLQDKMTDTSDIIDEMTDELGKELEYFTFKPILFVKFAIALILGLLMRMIF